VRRAVKYALDWDAAHLGYPFPDGTVLDWRSELRAADTVQAQQPRPSHPHPVANSNSGKQKLVPVAAVVGIGLA